MCNTSLSVGIIGIYTVRYSDSLFLEFGMISCGFNLHKFHLKKVALRSAA